MTQPSLVLLHGPPACGKSTLAAAIGEELHYFVVSRDRLKEALAGHLDVRVDDAERGATAFVLFYDCIRWAISNGVRTIAEQAFYRGVSEERLRRAVDGLDVSIVQLYCTADSATCATRFRRRSEASDRSGVDPDEVSVLDAMERGTFGWDVYKPLDLEAPLLTVDMDQPPAACAREAVTALTAFAKKRST